MTTKETKKTTTKKTAARTKASSDGAAEVKKTTRKAAGAGASGGINLVIVESPAKARTIEKYLGKDFRVRASVGHVIDLPTSKLGVDLENNFEPVYEIIKGKKKVLDDLKKAANEASTVYIATDPDREGEAIAWHIAGYIGAKNKNVYRATFNEITKQAVREAIEQPGQIDDNLVMAQQTRRILDRLVGYQISPLLWTKVRRGLSAGRVQSVAVRLLCEREAEIQAFVTEEYWSIEVGVEAQNPPAFRLRLSKIDGEKMAVSSGDAANAIVDAVREQPFVVRAVTKKQTKRNPAPPFITSTLQQEAARKLRLSPNQTMRIAQQLYKGLSVGEAGTVGLITYMRTDSTRIAQSALEGIREYIRGKHGAEFLPEQPNVYTSKKGAQDAHEAIRPTLLDRPPESLAAYLDEQQLGLYRLIWDRFVSSQMKPAQLEQTTIEVPVLDSKYLFIATGSVVTFPGFLAVYEEGKDEGNGNGKSGEEEERSDRLPKVEEGERLAVQDFFPEQHFTQPPARFSMSSLIRELEKRGIGRPSTYASIVSTILDREYAERVKGYIKPTELGKIVTGLLTESFPEVLDVAFTAHMEQELDEVEDGVMEWHGVLKEFYGTFQQRLEEAKTSMRSPKQEEQPTDIPCEKCGSMMVIKWGRNGHFLACSNYPECKNTKPYALDEEGKVVEETLPETEEKCEKCGAAFAVKNSRNGLFLACSNYPECKNTRPIAEIVDGKAVAQAALPETSETCDKCGSAMVVKNGRRGPFLACSGYPKCKNTRPIAEVKDGTAVAAAPMPEVDIKCEKCGSAMAVKNSRRGPFLACTGYPKCRNAKPLPEELKDQVPAASAAAAGPKANKPAPIETEEKCENCGKPMFLREGRYGPFLGCSGYPKCKTMKKPSAEVLEKYKKPEAVEVG